MATIPLVALQGRPIEQPPDQISQLGKLMAIKNQMAMAPLQQQQAQLENQKSQEDLNARQALNTAYHGAMTTGPDGKPVFDQNKLQEGLMSGPAAYQTPQVMKGITDYHTSLTELQKKTQDVQVQASDMLGSAASAVKAAGYDPVLAHSLLDALPQSPQTNQIRAQIDNPQTLHQLVDSAIQNSPKQEEQMNALKVAQIRSNTPDAQEMNSWIAANTKPGQPPPTPADYQQHKANESEGMTQQNDWIAKNPGKGASDFLLWKMQHSPSAIMIMGNQLQGEGLDFAANAYRQTLQLPGGLTRSPGTIQAIISRAAQLDAQDGGAGGAANKANYQADMGSLKNLQKNYDQINAFTETAEKNMRLLDSAAQKIPDLNVRFANIPVRMLASKGVGTPQMAAFNTALTSVQNESARILTTANATGTVLSDSARHELQSIVDGNLSYPALKSSLNTLHQEFGNRQIAYQLQLKDIKERISNPNQPPQGGNQQQTQGNDLFQQFGGKAH